jgi:hypothetical protein
MEPCNVMSRQTKIPLWKIGGGPRDEQFHSSLCHHQRAMETSYEYELARRRTGPAHPA